MIPMLLAIKEIYFSGSEGGKSFSTRSFIVFRETFCKHERQKVPSIKYYDFTICHLFTTLRDWNKLYQHSFSMGSGKHAYG